ncbi:hypothetical protein BH11PSE10_BH11PSE10_00500 [soil metagenome]
MTTVHSSLHPGQRRISSAAGLVFTILANGAIGRIDAHGQMVNLFPGNAMEGGPANLWLRLHGATDGSGSVVSATPLLGPLSPLSLLDGEGYTAVGDWQGLHIRLELKLAAEQPAWFWRVQIDNQGVAAQSLDLICVHDIGLSPYAAARVNEYYVSHYLDLSPLTHPQAGQVLAARQNLGQTVDQKTRNPWALLGSLRRGVGFATDALQFDGLSGRVGGLPPGVVQGLGLDRLQHEHGLLAIQDAPVILAAGQGAALGFFGCVRADHPAATSAADLAQVDALLALADRCSDAPAEAAGAVIKKPAASLFSSAPLLATSDLDAGQLTALFGPARRHEEWLDGELLSFTRDGAPAHVVLRAKELRVQRPHGHLLRSGQHLLPDEAALTSTVWMGGVFHSMVTQGHVSINRFLSTTRSWLSLFRSHGLRLFVEIEGKFGKQWQLLGLPSAFEIEPESCRWIYRHAGGLIEVTSSASAAPHALHLSLRVLEGGPLRVLSSLHIALGGDADGDDGIGMAPVLVADGGVFIGPPAGSELAQRLPGGGFHVAPVDGACFDAVGGAELLFGEPVAQLLPFICIRSERTAAFGLRIEGRLVQQAEAVPTDAAALPQLMAPAGGTVHAAAAQRLIDILPWFRHNALIHYLSPRGLEQFSGGGWGTRDVCQGPLEMLLALDKVAPVRQLLLQVFAAQNSDGDWPQWFMFFSGERHIRAGDSHGDVVFWPLLGLARYLLASEDAAVLDAPVDFYTAEDMPADGGTVWQHALRALAVIRQRHIEGTALVAYGHGDWNDSLQPADPQMRERMCSAWTVTLHAQVLSQLARALRGIGRADDAAPLEAEAIAVRADFQRLLVQDGVVAGYALFPENDAPPQLLLHPADSVTGVRYSLLPMMHAVLEDMLSAEQAQAHLALIRTHLTGPDGARLFDRPLPYRGGPPQLFQRAETSAFFGREIGVMYMHAHLRFAETLAHLGEAEAFFAALGLAHPLGLSDRLPQANLRQANCYFSSSDAAFPDRYAAGRDYAAINAGTVTLDGGWRIYSSGPGIALGLVVGRFLGLRREKSTLILDPVMPCALSGLRARVPLAGCELEIEYRLGTQGVGVTGVSLNGAPLVFTRGHNPYRVGAAVVAMSELLGRLSADGANELVVQTL